MIQLHRISPLDPADAFPDVSSALDQPPGLLAAGGDLSTERLLAAYRRGIFPWYEAGQPILWWSPDPRAIMRPSEFHVSRSLRRTLNRGHYETSIDGDFAGVINSCAAARPGQQGTWITGEMEQAYSRLHELGWAHSVETWHSGALVGGVYGVAIGRVFFAESMFSRSSDASKVALVRLTTDLQRWNFELIDCQMSSPHLASLGMREIPRSDFVAQLERLCSAKPQDGAWTE
ncbi:MAG: leucyl/phenylalanyl-tRNA--protein transferase [Gammaproteobacteria bacterium]|nr:leucyl/phenylalanyl-tRNA--protein transferase [Gammaproteobacteria bacterium]